MSLYPSLEDMKVDHMMQAQHQVLGSMQQQQQPVAQNPSAPPPTNPSQPSAANLPYPVVNPTAPLYPGLGNYMGLELSEDVIRANMPEYLASTQVAVPQQSRIALPNATGGNFVAPISSMSPAFGRSQLTHGIRQVVLCKDGDGRVGLRVRSINKGIFVCLVTKGSPAAMGGLRFGDQILQINGENLAGFNEEKVHDIFKRCGVNNIVLAVRDRPFERTLTLHKDSAGHLGFQYKDGKITGIIVESSAARNGLLIDHNLLEVNGQNVVGVKDKEISKIIDDSGDVVTVTVIPSYLYQHMMKSMAGSLVRKMMDHSIPDM